MGLFSNTYYSNNYKMIGLHSHLNVDRRSFLALKLSVVDFVLLSAPFDHRRCQELSASKEAVVHSIDLNIMEDNQLLHPIFPGPPVDAEANNDFDFLEQKDDPDDTYWLSPEQIDELNERQTGHYPTLSLIHI